MNAVDRISVGLTLVGCGFGAAVQGWPLWGAMFGFGLGFAVSGALRLVGDDRERQGSGDPR